MNSVAAQSFFSVSELLYLRLKIMIAQRMEVEELEGLTREKDYFAVKEAELRDQLVAEMHQMKSRLKFGKLRCFECFCMCFFPCLTGVSVFLCFCVFVFVWFGFRAGRVNA